MMFPLFEVLILVVGRRSNWEIDLHTAHLDMWPVATNLFHRPPIGSLISYIMVSFFILQISSDLACKIPS
jgi:hypothetical protein